jgi:hypothetical protein
MEKRGLTHATIAHEDNLIDRGSHSLLCCTIGNERMRITRMRDKGEHYRSCF